MSSEVVEIVPVVMVSTVRNDSGFADATVTRPVVVVPAPLVSIVMKSPESADSVSIVM